jgi:hypothetical protein
MLEHTQAALEHVQRLLGVEQGAAGLVQSLYAGALLCDHTVRLGDALFGRENAAVARGGLLYRGFWAGISALLSLLQAGAHLVSQPPTPWAEP